MKCDEHILLRFLASSLSVCLTVFLPLSLPSSLCLWWQLYPHPVQHWSGVMEGGNVLPSCECECDCELLWMCVRDNLFVSSSFRLLFFLSPFSLFLSVLFCFPVASFKHDNKDYSWSLLLLLLLLLAKH